MCYLWEPQIWSKTNRYFIPSVRDNSNIKVTFFCSFNGFVMGFYYRNYLTDISIREKNERTIYKMGRCIDDCYYYFLVGLTLWIRHCRWYQFSSRFRASISVPFLRYFYVITKPILSASFWCSLELMPRTLS